MRERERVCGFMLIKKTTYVCSCVRPKQLVISDRVIHGPYIVEQVLQREREREGGREGGREGEHTQWVVWFVCPQTWSVCEARKRLCTVLPLGNLTRRVASFSVQSAGGSSGSTLSILCLTACGTRDNIHRVRERESCVCV